MIFRLQKTQKKHSSSATFKSIKIINSLQSISNHLSSESGKLREVWVEQENFFEWYLVSVCKEHVTASQSIIDFDCFEIDGAGMFFVFFVIRKPWTIYHKNMNQKKPG